MNQRDIDAVLDDVNDADLMGGNVANLAVGEHVVYLSRISFKESKKDKSIYVDADFVVDESDVHEQGELKGWAWFPQAKGWGKTYQTGYLKQFQVAIGKCIGDEREPKLIGKDITSDKQNGRGTKIRVVISEQTDRAGNVKQKDGRTFTEAKWYPIEQTLEELKEARAMLDDLQGVKGSGGADDEAEEEAPAAQEPAKKTSLLNKHKK